MHKSRLLFQGKVGWHDIIWKGPRHVDTLIGQEMFLSELLKVC